MESENSHYTESRRSRSCPEVTMYYVQKDVLKRTSKHFKKYGMRRSEALVFWAGWLDEKCKAHVVSSKIPQNINWGEGVRVELDGMLKLMDELISEDLLLLAQVHSHPGDFGHSPGDDRSAASYKQGFVSVVVPNYGLKDLSDLSRCYVHEYVGNWEWRLLGKQEVEARFKVE